MNVNELPLLIFGLIILLLLDIGFIINNKMSLDKINYVRIKQDNKISKRNLVAYRLLEIIIFINAIIYCLVWFIVDSSLKYLSFFTGLIYFGILSFCMNKVVKYFDKNYARSKSCPISNKTIVYTYLDKRIEEELTYEKFISLLNDYGEFYFNYKDMSIEFGYHYENNRKVWELNINGYGNDAEYQYFNSVSELEKNARICGKTIVEVWDELTD